MGEPAQRFDSYIDFYKAEYASVIRRVTPLPFATLFETDQSAGDWGDKPHPDLVIARLKQGRGTFSIDTGAGRFNGRLEPNQTGIVAPYTHTSVQCNGQRHIQLVGLPYARLKQAIGDGFRLPDDGDFGALHAGMLTNSVIGHMVGAIFDAVDPGDPAAILFCESSLVSLVALLVIESGVSKIQPAPRGGLAPWQVRRATEMMMESEDARVPLVELAAAVGLSPFHFCRAFKHATGVAPHRHQALQRLERAKDLLAGTRLSILEVAMSVGYDSTQGLSRLFQRELGISPVQWRRQHSS